MCLSKPKVPKALAAAGSSNPAVVEAAAPAAAPPPPPEKTAEDLEFADEAEAKVRRNSFGINRLKINLRKK